MFFFFLFFIVVVVAGGGIKGTIVVARAIIDYHLDAIPLTPAHWESVNRGIPNRTLPTWPTKKNHKDDTTLFYLYRIIAVNSLSISAPCAS